MKKRIISGLCVSTLLFSQVSLSGDWGRAPLNKETELKLDIDGITQFDIEAGAGDIHVEGQKDNQEILVKAKIYGKRIHESDYTLVLNTRRGKARLEAYLNDEARNGERIDLKVFMPASMALNLDDRSGDIWVNGISANVAVNDRSGDIELRDLAGSVSVEDRSGDLIADRIGGDVDIEDRSGDIELKDSGGDITIRDSSGDVYVKDAGGKVTVSDSSGDIRINGAADFELKSDGSGDVSLRNIRDRQ